MTEKAIILTEISRTQLILTGVSLVQSFLMVFTIQLLGTPNQERSVLPYTEKELFPIF
jgi:hypothetical protein